MPPADATPAPLLEGLRVVEISQLIAAPLCGLTLRDWGAEVIKVESRHGEYARTLLPYFARGDSAFYYMMNRGKRSLSLRFGDEDARELLRRLIDSADVVVESLGGGITSLGITAEEAVARNPKLIWCSITGHGRDRGGRAMDPSLQASMGMMALTGDPDGPPMRLPISLVDYMTAMYANQSILAALMRVREGADGEILDCALLDSAATLAASAGVHALSGEEPMRRIGTENKWYVPAGNFEAADGRWVQLIAINEQHWRALAAVLGHPEWGEDERFAGNDERLEHRTEIHSLIREVIRTRPAAHWSDAVTAAGGFCEVILEIEDAWQAPILHERGLIRTNDASGELPSPIPVASLTRAGRTPVPEEPAPGLGEHSTAVALELGYDHDQVARMTASGALVAGAGVAG